METIKCVTVGDGKVGKTCLLVNYVEKFPPTEYIPTVFDNYSKLVQVDGRQIKLELWDTAGQEVYDRRPLVYSGSDVCLICFSITAPSSFKHVEKKWTREIKHRLPNCCIILVGTKCDLRYNQHIINSLNMTNEKPISFREGFKMAQKIGARKYVECSAITREGLNAVFDAAVRGVIHPQVMVTKKRLCSIL